MLLIFSINLVKLKKDLSEYTYFETEKAVGTLTLSHRMCAYTQHNLAR
jgi:hypothetical protein